MMGKAGQAKEGVNRSPQSTVHLNQTRAATSQRMALSFSATKSGWHAMGVVAAVYLRGCPFFE